MNGPSANLNPEVIERGLLDSALLRLALLCDYREEGWPSMDLCADMLSANLPVAGAGWLKAEQVCPVFQNRVSRLPWLGRGGVARNADRLLNRFWDYPRELRRRIGEFDLFHLCDHSYSQLLHVLPPGQTGVFCYDLDTFRCLLKPNRERRPRWFRVMARRVLSGFQQAAIVFYATATVREEILQHGLIDASRLVYVPLGIATEFTPEAKADLTAEALLASLGGAPFLLHVGSSIPRKRMDVLLEVFTAVRARYPGLRLVQVGGLWSAEQRGLIDQLGVGAALTQVRGLTRWTLAALYRRAALVLLPSESEGFGLPVIEALACGQVVLASDLPVFREVAGDALVYCAVANVPAWVDAVCRLLADQTQAPSPAMRRTLAQRYSWKIHAQTIAEAYRRLAGFAA